jgi:hypothetical protein
MDDLENIVTDCLGLAPALFDKAQAFGQPLRWST